MARMSMRVAGAVVLVGAGVLYGADVAAFVDPGATAMLGQILANATKQLAVAKETLLELQRSYTEAKKVADLADDAVSGARSFEAFSRSSFGDRFQKDLDAALPNLAQGRKDALSKSGLSGSDWAKATGADGRTTTYCAGSGSTDGCVPLAGELDTGKVLTAVQGTFDTPAAAAAEEAKVVDAEVAATIVGDSAENRAAALQKARVRALLRTCNSAADVSSTRDAKRLVEECRTAADQAQLLHLEEGQETNVRLAQLARLQALALEQRNADLKRELAERAARLGAITDGLDALVAQQVGIKAGGLSF